MDHAEEQENELMALESIYMDDFKKLDEDAAFELTLVPETGGENHVSAALRVKYTPTYPEAPPELSAHNIKGLTDEQISELEEMVRADAQTDELLGSAMVYMLAEKVQAWLLERNEPEADLHAEMMKRQAAQSSAAETTEGEAGEAAERDADTSSVGKPKKGGDPEGTWRGDGAAGIAADATPVTAETFAAWRAEYDAAQAAAAAAAAAAAGGKNRNFDERCKFTGRQIFEQNDSNFVLEDAGALQDGEEEDVMTMRAQDDGEEGADAEPEEADGGGADDVLEGVGDEALFEDEEDLPDE